MELRDFAIGRVFANNGHSLWLCTDIGTRVVVAIRIDSTEFAEVKVRRGRRGPETRTAIDPRKDPSWFDGPPYALAKTVFDEYDHPTCMPVAEEDVAAWTPERERDRWR
ncbi:hypothetical protein GCM10009416_14850 [Craurococcus roseus]|uniref:Uncharacterized protein n=1 Tax=Craurococcus roseus TaxID=77585 RepID=A0ABN1EYY0_9PROT